MTHNGRFHHYQYLLFDLDDTLYPVETGLMKAIGDRIALFMTQKLGIPAEDTGLKRREYYQKYGTSLRGVMEDYHVSPADFLNCARCQPPRFLLGQPAPRSHAAELPLKKVIFTNSDRTHSLRVLDTSKCAPTLT
jgi:putative hydrolase of the HAD superfamily